jgi:hypothetical protein
MVNKMKFYRFEAVQYANINDDDYVSSSFSNPSLKYSS